MVIMVKINNTALKVESWLATADLRLKIIFMMYVPRRGSEYINMFPEKPYQLVQAVANDYS
jgi:hypothetical protein